MKRENILIADDDEGIRWVLEKFLDEKGFSTSSFKDGLTALNTIKGDSYTLAIIDITMPGLNGFQFLEKIKGIDHGLPVIIMTGQGTMKNAIEAMKGGAYDYITKPFDLDELGIIIDRAVESRRLRDEVLTLKGRIKARLEKETVIIGKSPPMQRLYKIIGKVAPQDVTVLISGESGTGKELVARVIHLHSKRAQGPFIAINSAAIPKELMESEMFGFEKGAFTGATEERPGKFELAQGGTLFLDEIGDMPLDLQSKLLRIIQEKEFYKLGGKRAIKLNVRLITATNQDLTAAVSGKRFREDLFHRLNVVNIPIPPLRKRKDDIPLLTEHILNGLKGEMGGEAKDLSEDALQCLVDYNWPGNVRELENTLKRAFILSSDPVIKSHELNLAETDKTKKKDSLNSTLEGFFAKRLEDVTDKVKKDLKGDLYSMVIRWVEKPLIELILKKTRGNQILASRILGINRNTLRKKIKELKVKI
ncbi:MAG: sigma-54-dependent transcriptional regulator [Thermodesulfobacteriota bacterium]